MIAAIRRNWLTYPSLLWYAIFVIAPFFILFAYSFATNLSQGEISWTFTLENYGQVFRPTYLRVAWFSVQLALWNTLSCVLVGYPVAYFIAHLPTAKLRNLFLLLLLIPFWTNFLIRTYALAAILGDEGLINSFLMWTGAISRPLDLIYSKQAMVIGLLSNYLPFMVLPIFVSLEKLDSSLREAAMDLGASPTRTFLKVTVPLSLPGVIAGSIMVFIPSLGEFIVPDLLGGGKYMLLGSLLQQKFLVTRNWPLGSAISVVLTAILLALLFATRKYHGDDKKSA